MLFSFKDKYVNAYNILQNEIINDSVSHAYLIDENNNSDAFLFVKSFVKSIVCNNKFTSSCSDSDCSICARIDNDNYPEVRVIEADGMYIKKQQILDLQQLFSRSLVEGKKKVYIIRDADKMRPETANSMLKFLEEPSENIVAILMTNNYNNIMPTIISRCQVIKLNGNDNLNDLFIDDYYDVALNFVYNIETEGINTILKTKDLWTNYVGNKDRDLAYKIFDLMIDIYYNVIKIKNGMIVNENNFDKIKEIAEKNNLNNLINKVNYLINMKDTIKNNVNIALLIDSVIVNLGGKNECSWC